jgi:tetratricopeptide (TPR) repeat protein
MVSGDPERAAPAVNVPWWQRWLPGGDRRLARRAMAHWRQGDAAKAAASFSAAAALDPDDDQLAFDLGTALAAAGDLEGAIAGLDRAQAAGVPGAAYNAGTAALGQGQAEQAVARLRQALLAEPGAPEVKRNYELALQLLEQEQEQQQQEQPDGGEPPPPQATPSPSPSPPPDDPGEPPLTPTPDPSAGLLGALERAEREARDAMRSPTPQPGTVEKDW